MMIGYEIGDYTTLWYFNITMERSTMLLMGKSTISMAIFNSYFDITRGYTTRFNWDYDPWQGN